MQILREQDEVFCIQVIILFLWSSDFVFSILFHNFYIFYRQ